MIVDTSVILDFLWQKEPISTELTVILAQSDEPVRIVLPQKAEVCDVSKRSGLHPDDVLSAVEKMTEEIPLQSSDLIDAGILKWKMRDSGRSRFSLADAILLAVGQRRNERIITSDGAFRDLEGVTVVGKPATS